MEHEPKLTHETSPLEKLLLSEILSRLAFKGYQLKLLVGLRDSLNGYGWHTIYYIEIIKCIEYCPKCRIKFNLDYKEDYYPLHHQHSHRQEYKTIFSKEFMCEKEMMQELVNFA